MKERLFANILFAVVLTYLIPMVIFYVFNDKIDKIYEEDYYVTVYLKDENEFIELELEEYVLGVVAAEMPATFDFEALKAQAVAARTYVVRYLKYNEYITDTILHQAYLTDDDMKAFWGDQYPIYYQKVALAVQSTKGEVIVYENELIEPVYFSISNGFTENSEDFWIEKRLYLRSVPSTWDTEISIAIYSVEISLVDFNGLLGTNVTNNSQIVELSRTDGNRIKEIMIDDKVFTGKEVMEMIGLRSSDFSIDIEGNQAVITTNGFGHGVGMSQYGANGMAESGYDYDEILKYYYRNVDIIPYFSE